MLNWALPTKSGTRFPRNTRFLRSAPAQGRYAYCERLARSHYENFSVATLVFAQAPAPAFFQRLRLLPDFRRSRRRNWRHHSLLAAARRMGSRIERLLRGKSAPSTFLSHWRERCANSIFPNRLLPTCSPLSVRTRPLRATKPSTTFSGTAATPQIRSGTWFCTSADIATPSASSFPISPAPRSSSQISGKTSVLDYEKGRIYLPLEDLRQYRCPGSRYRRQAEHTRNSWR